MRLRWVRPDDLCVLVPFGASTLKETSVKVLVAGGLGVFHLDGIPSAVLQDWVGVVAGEGLDSLESLSLVLKSEARLAGLEPLKPRWG